MPFILPEASPEALNLDPHPLRRLCALIDRHIAEGHHPGAQLAIARHGKLALAKNFGDARVDPTMRTDADTLFLLYSNTKVVTAATLWTLVEEGRLSFADPVAKHLKGFDAHGKGAITVAELLSHQAGFPGADMQAAAWEDRALRHATVCGYSLEWTPGSQVVYHPAAAHWVAAALIEALTGEDFRDVIRARIIAPLGLEAELFVGLPDAEHHRAAGIYDPPERGMFPARMPENTPEGRRAGIPGGGGYATARAMAAFYQMLVGGGVLDGRRVLSPRMVEFATRNVTGDRIDTYMGMAMHRALGPHVRGTTPSIRGLGTLAHPATFGHGGVGSSYCWADPTSGVSFAFLSNCRQENGWHSARMDLLSNLAHAAILPG